MQIIDNWIKNGRNFIAGRAIYNTLGTDAGVKELLQQSASPFAVQRLAEELEELNSNGLHKVVVVTSTAAEMPDDDNVVLQAFKKEWLKPYQQMQFVRHDLHKFGNSNTNEAIEYRKMQAFKILLFEQQCNEIWARRNAFAKTGELPKPTETPGVVIPTDPLLLGKFIESCKRQIRRNRLQKESPAAQQRYLHYKNLYKQATGEDYKEVEK